MRYKILSLSLQRYNDLLQTGIAKLAKNLSNLAILREWPILHILAKLAINPSQTFMYKRMSTDRWCALHELTPPANIFLRQ
nr:hypothetical protein [uncultured Capnocytophaga sp.]